MPCLMASLTATPATPPTPAVAVNACVKIDREDGGQIPHVEGDHDHAADQVQHRHEGDQALRELSDAPESAQDDHAAVITAMTPVTR